MINFGDGSPEVEIGEETTYTYSQEGIYMVSLRGQGGADDEPVMAKMHMVVG